MIAEMTITDQKKGHSMKHVPQRTCIGCRMVKPKRELIRIVRNEAGDAMVDPTGKRPGRGVYVCKAKVCWENALKREQLDHALRTKIASEDRRELGRYGDTFSG
jgi:predicted RNA-binding protein YlxR (DUF448 family)